MHIVDGILSNEVCLATGVIAVGAVGLSLRKLNDSLGDRTVPMTGMMAAVVFAGQMINFPIGAPVSGHLLGGVLASVILGPWAGCLALTLVLVVQCLLFADGGLMPLGTNILHMGVIGSMGGYAVYAVMRRLLGNGARGTIVGAVVASWLSVMAAAALFCMEFRLSWISGEYDFSQLFTLMVSFHSLIGVGEALITGMAVGFVLLHRPDSIYVPEPSTKATMAGARAVGRFAAAGAVSALALAAFLSPFASGFPDGLEAAAERIGFEDLAKDPATAVLADYEIPLPISSWRESPGWQKVSVSLAGILGTSAVLLISLILGRAMRLRMSMAGANRVE